MAPFNFAYLSRDLYTQVHVIEDLVRSSVWDEAGERLQAAKGSCDHLETLVEEDNQVQRRIVTNRKLEIHWLDTAIQAAQEKSPKKTVKRRAAKKA